MTGEDRFIEKSYEFVSPNIIEKLKNRWKNVDLSLKIRTLMRNDETGYLEEVCGKLFEEVFARFLLTGYRKGKMLM